MVTCQLGIKNFQVILKFFISKFYEIMSQLQNIKVYNQYMAKFYYSVANKFSLLSLVLTFVKLFYLLFDIKMNSEADFIC